MSGFPGRKREHASAVLLASLRDLSVNFFFLGVESLLAYFQRRVKKRKTLRPRRKTGDSQAGCPRSNLVDPIGDKYIRLALFPIVTV